jgi:bifunctional UDP-N-acetylglucosamine pyrophosphorylase / glucosamine-1-phosphate N-acetyltransferase
MKLGFVVLAAGQGTRLKLDCAKPLAPLNGSKVVDYSITAIHDFAKTGKNDLKISIVTGYQREEVETHLKNRFPNQLDYTFQAEQNGTGHAVQCFMDQCEWGDKTDYTFILCADTPLLTSDIFSSLFETINSQNCDAVGATFEVENPTGYGRVVRGEKSGFSIIEEKDASEEIKKIKEVNSGLYVFKTSFLKEYISQINNNNNSGELYLVDLFQSDRNVLPLLFTDRDKFLGINDLFQLETASMRLRIRKVRELMSEGVRFLDTRHVFIDHQVKIEKGTTVYPYVCLEGETEILSDCIIEMGCVVKNARLGEGVRLLSHSNIEGAHIQKGSCIGPFARLRPGAEIGESCKIGNFVEIKKSQLDKEVKVSHLSYVGDSEIGENSNIGCGFVSCNYDGANKHKTIIGKDCFIGSDSQTVAPVKIGDASFVASGSTITQDMPPGSFAIARTKQTTKPDMARRFLKKK